MVDFQLTLHLYLFQRENATLMATVISLFGAAFNGYGLTIETVQGWGMYWFWCLQFSYWGSEATYSQTLALYDHVWDSELANSVFGYSLNRVALDYTMMLVIGSLWRVAAYFAMISFNRDKQK